jgi:hypothetical protein
VDYSVRLFLLFVSVAFIERWLAQRIFLVKQSETSFVEQLSSRDSVSFS